MGLSVIFCGPREISKRHLFLVLAKAVDYFSASRKQKRNFSASTASSKEQCSTTINWITAMLFCHPKLFKRWRDKVCEALYTFTWKWFNKNTWFSMNYNEESIDINPIGQIIVSIASSATIAINSPTAPDASSAYNVVKCPSWYCWKMFL